MPNPRNRVQLVAREPLTREVDLLRFEAEPPFVWAAGQYLVVVDVAGQEVFLPYSIASAQDSLEPREFELAVARRTGAELMTALPLGGQLDVEGPAGEFTWQPEPSPAALLIGVGTGIAPLRALVQAELARDSPVRLLLLAGHRAPEDVLFASDFASLAARHPRFRFVPTLTYGGPQWLGLRGRVQAHLATLLGSLGSLDAYVCGRVDMVQEVVNTLQAAGVPRARIRDEGF